MAHNLITEQWAVLLKPRAGCTTLEIFLPQCPHDYSLDSGESPEIFQGGNAYESFNAGIFCCVTFAKVRHHGNLASGNEARLSST